MGRRTSNRFGARMNPTNPHSNRTKPAAPNQARPELPHIGPFQVLAELGRGGMGAVYRARDTRLNREVAVKVLAPELVADATAKLRFLREAGALAAIEHDHIVPIHEINDIDGVAYIVMPLLKGMPLSAALKQNPRPPVAELVRIGREIAEGLAAAHAAGLVHRDIKPGNVWLEAPKRRVKILDFGIARGTAAAPGSRADADALTARGELLGTPHYMSPEQARSKPVDFRSDLFSLGVVLYQMATGARPFDGEASFDVMTAVVSEHPPAVAEVIPGFPPVLSDLIDRLLAKDPAARPASALAVAEELEQVLNTISMRSVVVLPLPDAAGGAPNPWAELDTTHGREPETRRADATRRAPRAADPPEEGDEPDDTDAEPRTYRAARGGAPTWLLPAALAGLLLAVALVVVLWPKGKDKDGGAQVIPPDPNGDTKTKTGGKQNKKEVSKPDHERALAEAVLPYAELVLELRTGGERTVPPNGALPDGAFAVTKLNFQPGPRPPDAFRAGTLLPKLVEAGGLSELLDRTGHLGYWNESEWNTFCTTKSKGALVQINVFAPLTHDSLNLMKGFPKLSGMRFVATHAEPDALLGLRDLNLDSLALDMLGREVAPVPDTWKRLSDMKLRSLFLWDVHGLTADAADVLAAMPNLTELGVGGDQLTEPVLLKLFARKELTSVAVGGCTKATDAVCDAILNRDRLHYVELDRVPNVTADGVAAIRTRHPKAVVVWDGDAPKVPKASGLAFDGKDNRVEVEKFGFDGKLPLTVEAWVTPASFGKDGSDRHLFLFGTLSGGSGGVGFTPADGLGVGVRLKDGGFATNFTVNRFKPGERVHVAAVVSQKRIELFANGKEVGWKDVDLPATVEPIPGPAAIGGTVQHSGGLNFHGTIHALRVSRAVRYQQAKKFDPPATFEKDADTLALYKFDEGKGTKVTDHSGNGFHGEIKGTPTWVK